MSGRTTMNRRIVHEVDGILKRLAEVAVELRGFDNAGSNVDRHKAALSEELELSVAKRLMTIWRARTYFFEASLVEDPGWLILLSLKIAELAHQRVSVSMLCGDSLVPATTGLRWISSMERKGLLERKPDRMDGRRALMSLSETTSKAMSRCLAELAPYLDASGTS